MHYNTPYLLINGIQDKDLKKLDEFIGGLIISPNIKNHIRVNDKYWLTTQISMTLDNLKSLWSEFPDYDIRPCGIYCYDIEVLSNYFSFLAISPYQPDNNFFFEMSEWVFDKSYLHNWLGLSSEKAKWDDIVLIGFNSKRYDKPMTNIALRASDNDYIYQKSLGIIRYRETHGKTKDERICMMSNFFTDIDLVDILNLYDNDTKMVRKGLKSIAISLNANNIIDFPVDYNKPLPIANKNKFEKYHVNDVQITCKLATVLMDNIRYRELLSKSFKVDVMSLSESSMADVVLFNLYKKEIGVHNLTRSKINKSACTYVNLGDCVATNVFFTTDRCKQLLETIKTTELNPETYKENRDKLPFNKITIGDTVYQLGLGGLHSEDKSEIFESDDNHTIIMRDVSSYYPSIILVNNLCPKHLNCEAFIKIYKTIYDLKNNPTTAQHYIENMSDKAISSFISGIKLVLNSVSGKAKSHRSWLYDPAVNFSITINGQLYLLMAIEQLELQGIKVISANTDSFTCQVPNDKLDTFNSICDNWQEWTGFRLDQDNIDKYVRYAVNSYVTVIGDKIKTKGDYFTTINEVKLNKPTCWNIVSPQPLKGYKMPIIATAINEYFVNGIPIKDTITSCKNIQYFLTSENSSASAKLVDKTTGQVLPKTNRFYIAKHGHKIIKVIGDKESNFSAVKSRPSLPLNHINPSDDFNNYHVDLDFYIKDAQTIVNMIQPKFTQYSLF